MCYFSPGNASKAFIQLEMEVIPVKFVVMQKQMNFLHYILNEDINSLLRQVFDALREDSRKGDFISLTNRDRIDLKIDQTNEEIADMTKCMWKKYVKEMVKSAALESLVEENNTKERTRDIMFETLQISGYLETDMRTPLSKLIFNVRSKTLNIKDWCPWNYSDLNCVACGKFPEIIDHFTVCKAYRNEPVPE